MHPRVCHPWSWAMPWYSDIEPRSGTCFIPPRSDLAKEYVLLRVRVLWVRVSGLKYRKENHSKSTHRYKMQDAWTECSHIIVDEQVSMGTRDDDSAESYRAQNSSLDSWRSETARSATRCPKLIDTAWVSCRNDSCLLMNIVRSRRRGININIWFNWIVTIVVIQYENLPDDSTVAQMRSYHVLIPRKTHHCRGIVSKDVNFPSCFWTYHQEDIITRSIRDPWETTEAIVVVDTIKEILNNLRFTTNDIGVVASFRLRSCWYVCIRARSASFINLLSIRSLNSLVSTNRYDAAKYRSECNSCGFHWWLSRTRRECRDCKYSVCRPSSE